MTITILAAFLGGFISLFTPCSVMVIPTFAAAASKRVDTFVKTTLIFSFGLLLALIPVGLSLNLFMQFLFSQRQFITHLIGIVIGILGLLTLIDHHLPWPNPAHLLFKSKKTGYPSIFALGAISGLGSSACVGPIFGAIVSLAAVNHNKLEVFPLIFAYAFGLILPLVIIAALYDKYVYAKISKFKHQQITLGPLKITYINAVGGILLLFIAYVFLAHQGSLALIPLFRKVGILNFFFDLQDQLFLLK